ncbi:MAG: PKD domain-containing protein [Bacteroidota bacterium]
MKPVIDFIKTHSNVFQFRLKYEENGNTTPSNEIRIKETDLMNDSNLNVLWDFGDGHFSTERTPIHTYTIPGDYRVKAYLDYGQYENTIHISEPVDSQPEPSEIPPSTRGFEPVDSQPEPSDIPPSTRGFEPVDSQPEPSDMPPASRGFEPVDSQPEPSDIPPSTRGFEPVDSQPEPSDIPPASRGFEPVDSQPEPSDMPPASRGFEPVDSQPEPSDIPPASRGFEPVDSQPEPSDMPPASRGFEPVDSQPEPSDMPPASRSLNNNGLGVGPPSFPDSANVSVMRGNDWQSIQGVIANPPSIFSSDLIEVSFPKFSTSQTQSIAKIYILITFNKNFNKDHYLVLSFNDLANTHNELLLSRITDRLDEVRWKPLLASGTTAIFRDNIIVDIQGREHLLLEFWTTEREKEELSFLVEVVSKIEKANSSSLNAVRHDHLIGRISLK